MTPGRRRHAELDQHYPTQADRFLLGLGRLTVLLVQRPAPTGGQPAVGGLHHRAGKPSCESVGRLTRAEAQGAFRDLHAGPGRVGKALLLFQIDLQARGSPWARSPGAERPYGDPRNLIGLGPAKGGALGMRTRSAAPAFPTPTAVPG